MVARSGRRRRLVVRVAVTRLAQAAALAVAASLLPFRVAAAQPQGNTAPVESAPASTATPSPSAPAPALPSATPPAPAKPAAKPASAPAASLVPPSPLGSLHIPYPKSAPRRASMVTVTVLITIGADGRVSAVKLLKKGGEPFDAAVVTGAKKFLFRPATFGGQAVPVAVPYSQTFVPPPPPPPGGAKGPPLDALLEGLVIERGTREPVQNATVVVQDPLGMHVAETDQQGHFLLPLTSGKKLVKIVAADHRAFRRTETLGHEEHFQVKYLVDRESYNPYESTVVGERDRETISKTTLSGREIHQLPGTFGDPFRVVEELPGVTSVMSLLPLPIVRGSSPGDTGIFLDGVRLPALFHLFGGPSVIAPELIDRIDFYPGGFPVSYGGYVGGIIDGRTERPDDGRSKLDLDLNLLQSGLYAQHPIPGTSMVLTVAGRYGYPGLLLSLLTTGLSLGYWDYQARLTGGHPGSEWSVFAYGSEDVLAESLPPSTSSTSTSGSTTGSGSTPASGTAKSASSATTMTTLMKTEFHRLDLTWKLGGEDKYGLYRFVAGYDDSGGVGVDLSSAMVDPQASWMLPLSKTLRVHAGAELLLQYDLTGSSTSSGTQTASYLSTVFPASGALANGGAYVEAPWKPNGNLLVTPGVRVDGYTDNETTNDSAGSAHAGLGLPAGSGSSTKRVWQWSVDPRVSARWRPPGWKKVWLKGVVGRYHQPPRFFIPIPGESEAPLSGGLLASTQYSVGTEASLAPGVDLDVQTYYNDMDPVLFDLSTNSSMADILTVAPTTLPGGTASGNSSSSNPLAALQQKTTGRAYGLEILLRKRDTSSLFGWIAYTLSRSERHYATGWAPYDFDRTHILNAVAGIRLPRNWEFGARLLLESGTPVTTTYGRYNSARTPWDYEIDLRIDKRAVWNTWLLDFYVDILNASVAPQTGGLTEGEPVRYVLPTIGFRALL